MDTQPKLTQTSIPQTPISPQVTLDPTPQSKKSIILPIFVSIPILALVVAVTSLYLQTRSLRSQLNPSPTPIPSSTTQPSEYPTSTWQIYTSKEYGFSFKYPISWNLTSKSTNEISLSKKISKNDITIANCNNSTDCKPEGTILISILRNNTGETNECSLFGECLLAEKKEVITKENTSIRLEYFQQSSIYPSFTFINIPGYVIRAKSYLPSASNCIGSCDDVEDSMVVKNIGEELTQILSTFQFTD